MRIQFDVPKVSVPRLLVLIESNSLRATRHHHCKKSQSNFLKIERYYDLLEVKLLTPLYENSPLQVKVMHLKPPLRKRMLAMYSDTVNQKHRYSVWSTCSHPRSSSYPFLSRALCALYRHARYPLASLAAALSLARGTSRYITLPHESTLLGFGNDW